MSSDRSRATSTPTVWTLPAVGAALAAAVLGAIWGLVGTRVPWLPDLDARVAVGAHAAVRDDGWLLHLAWGFTQSGGPISVNIVMALMALYLFVVRHDLAAGALVVLMRVAVVLIGGGVKLLEARPRPVFADPVAHAAGFSFPSAHTYGTVVAASSVLYLAARLELRRAVLVPLAVVCAMWVAGVGASRILLGVHWLSDVVAGAALGAAVSLCAFAGWSAWQGRQRDRPRSAAGRRIGD